MDWIEAVFTSTGEDVEILADRLCELGADGVVIEDEADFRNFLEQNKQYWDYVDEELDARFSGISRVKLYVSDDEEGRAKLARMSEALGKEPLCSAVRDSDWENGWRKYYKPMEIGEKLLVVPSWEENINAGARSVLRLDPGLTFGTGSHATTRMCLEAIERYARKGARVLDLGCGSGILFIGSLILGCESAVACDIDPLSPKIAHENAALNSVNTDKFTVYGGNIITDLSLRSKIGDNYDIVLANIVADVIIPLSSYVKQFMSEDGIFICSGIIEGRQDEVLLALERQGLVLQAHLSSEDWHCFQLSRS